LNYRPWGYEPHGLTWLPHPAPSQTDNLYAYKPYAKPDKHRNEPRQPTRHRTATNTHPLQPSQTRLPHKPRAQQTLHPAPQTNIREDTHQTTQGCKTRHLQKLRHSPHTGRQQPHTDQTAPRTPCSHHLPHMRPRIQDSPQSEVADLGPLPRSHQPRHREGCKKHEG
jgi:hypothetical protein